MTELKGISPRRGAFVALRLGFVFTAALCANAAAADTIVTIDNFTFAPAEVSVAPGETVVWINRDDIPHRVVGTDKGFDSKALDTDDRFAFTFSTPGDYDYFCSLHPHMIGKIIVRADR